LGRKRELIEKQSVVLLEKVRNVCKLVMVEGEFSEIYNHQNNKDYLFGLLQSKKKALLQVNAKVHIGYDLKKIEIIPDNKNKTIILKKFPQPEILAFENNYKIYDIDQGIF
jgi:Mg2+/Co2+ transporter CorC